MEAAETQLARALAALTEREFPQSRGRETRLDAYLQLEELLRLEDSETSVVQLRAHVTPLLGEFRFDLQHSTLSDELQAALRCLSYFMHHRSLAAAFSDEHMAFFLGELARLLFATQDQNVYKLCLWCLTVQNFPAERHKFLPQTVEGLVQAVVNPFKSRAIEVQALKGLHLLLVKYPEQVAVNGAALNIYVRPIASRLASSELSTRTQARLVLTEASKHLPQWTEETLTMVQDCTQKYVLPVMKVHMDRDRHKDAVHLWQLALVLLRSRFSADLAMLNQVLYVPEKFMEDEDAAVRLMAMQAWGGLADIFHDTKLWLFQKAVVSLLAWPIKVCLKQERLLNIAEAAFGSWRKVVRVAVQDFNEFCESDEAVAQNFPGWRKWFSELVMSPLLTVMKNRIGNSDGRNSTLELEQFIDFAKQIWGFEVRSSDKDKSSSSRSESSSSTTMGESSMDGLGGGKQATREPSTDSQGQEVDAALTQKSTTPDCQSCDHVSISSTLIGIACLLEDVAGAVQNLIEVSDESRREYCKSRGNELAIAIWTGYCQRFHSNSRRKGTLPSDTAHTLTLEQRVLRMCIDFTFGILTSRSDVPSSNDQSGQNLENPISQVVVASVGFGLEWELRLLAPLVSGVANPSDLHTVMLHSKSKLFDHIVRRMDYLKEMYAQCLMVLKKWDNSEAGEVWIDFSARANGLPYLLINLLFEYAVFIDDMNNDHGDGKQSTLTSLDIVVKKLVASIKVSTPNRSRNMDAIIRFGEEAIRAAHELFDDNLLEAGKRSMLDELVSISTKFTEHTFESQQNASLLLDLHQSHRSVVIPPSASTASSATPSDASDVEEKRANIVGQESEYVSASLDTSTSSPCLLSGEVATMPSASPVDPSPTPSADEQQQIPNTRRESPDHRTNTDGEKESRPKSALVTPQKAKTLGEMDSTSSAVSKPKLPPAGLQSAPAAPNGGSIKRPKLKAPQCIYPDLVGCTEGIASLYRHFPMGFRPFFSFYKVKTIGDLSALPVERVRTFGLKEPVSTVRRALEEFNGRKGRMKSLNGSPFRQRSGSATTSPAIPTPSPHKPPKRPFQLETGGIAPLALEKRQHKRTKRSLVLDGVNGDDEEESEGSRQKPKLADRVTFCLQAGETGETRITRPGEDSQDQLKPSEKVEEKENAQEKMETFTLKLLQHLRRSVYYMDKLVAEEESVQSEEASLQTSITTVGGVIANYQEAHDLVSRLTSQLQVAAETSSKRCEKLLDKRGLKG
ncbi:hypothetical protein PR001_g5254 [Phytophthora rubi]|uniref:Telomere-associated protein Rif1 N-terminal domain-containing protein n=1 Tax=Phytophthora rubi TaxID=129364 RepID=A0A6A3NT70_9STRA|nr:hypothetical protein PR002_g5285 [Phytophthora rubi]KAE9044716.1 hypothetical protein PR001_g5254 [Phytophthora rubi]